MHIFMYVLMYACMCACVSMCVFGIVCLCMWVCVVWMRRLNQHLACVYDAWNRSWSNLHMCVCVCVCTYIHTTYIHPNIHPFIHTLCCIGHLASFPIYGGHSSGQHKLMYLSLSLSLSLFLSVCVCEWYIYIVWTRHGGHSPGHPPEGWRDPFHELAQAYVYVYNIYSVCNI